MIAGGLFTQVTDPMNGTPYTRQNLFAFDATTGLVSQTFNPTDDGQVQQLLPGPTPDTVYVAGDFTKINGKGPNHLQLLNVNTGQAVTSFKAPTTNGGIETMEMLPGNRLFIGGFFTKIGAVDARPVGDPQRDHRSASTRSWTSPWRATTTPAPAPRRRSGPRESGVTPAGDRTGRGRQLPHRRRPRPRPDRDGRPDRRERAVSHRLGHHPLHADLLRRAPSTATCATSRCRRTARSSSSPATGGPHSGTLCDTAVRFETYAVGTALTPTWTDTSGGRHARGASRSPSRRSTSAGTTAG